jgi:hypothetical protein
MEVDPVVEEFTYMNPDFPRNGPMPHLPVIGGEQGYIVIKLKGKEQDLWKRRHRRIL